MASIPDWKITRGSREGASAYASKSRNMEQFFFAEQARHEYTLAYVPAGTKLDSDYHRIELQVSGNGLITWEGFHKNSRAETRKELCEGSCRFGRLSQFADCGVRTIVSVKTCLAVGGSSCIWLKNVTNCQICCSVKTLFQPGMAVQRMPC